MSEEDFVLTIDINTIFNLILSAAMGYIAWSFKDRDAKKEKRIECVENDVKTVKQNVSDRETKYYKDFVTKEQHDMDINAVLHKLDDLNDVSRKIYMDIGKLIGRSEKDGK